MWRAQADAVAAAGYARRPPDLPGFGETALLDSPPSLDAVGDVIAKSLRADGGVWAVVGISLGGYLAMNLARRHGELLAGVALCDTKATADPPAAREQRNRLANVVEEPSSDTARVLEQAVLPGLVGATTHDCRPDVVRQVRQWLRMADGRSVAWYQRAMAERPDSLAVLADFAQPSLVLWGEEDTLSPDVEQDLMLSVLTDSMKVKVPAAGHLTAVEDPSAVSLAILRWLERVSTGNG